MISRWTDTRLKKLLDRYRRRYWPRSRRLRTYSIQVSSLDNAYGEIDPDARILKIDIGAHPSDREIRATVLHEMIHVVAGIGHGWRFWVQLEYLLSQKGPISVGFPELGEQDTLLHIVPTRFRRCRRLFRPIFERQQRALERMKHDGPAQGITPSVVERESYDATLEGSLWAAIWHALAQSYGFVDLDGNLVSWARPYRVAARRGYLRGRRFFLENKRVRAKFMALRGALYHGPTT